MTGDGTSSNEYSDDDNHGLSGGAIAGIVIGIIVGLIFVMLLAVVILYFIKGRQESMTKHPSAEYVILFHRYIHKAKCCVFIHVFSGIILC